MQLLIRFLNSERVKHADIISRMQQQYGQSCLSVSKIYERIYYIKNGQISLFNEQWKHRSSTSKNNGNSVTIFCDMEVPIFVHSTSKGETVSSDNYCELLRFLSTKIKSTRNDKLSIYVILFQDNALTYMAIKTTLCPAALGFDLLDHPLYTTTIQS